MSGRDLKSWNMIICDHKLPYPGIVYNKYIYCWFRITGQVLSIGLVYYGLLSELNNNTKGIANGPNIPPITPQNTGFFPLFLAIK